MQTHTLTERSKKKRSTFSIACIVLGIIAFVQVMMMGVATAMRMGETRVVTQTIEGDPQVYLIPTLKDERKSNADIKVKPRDLNELMSKYGNNHTQTDSIRTQPRSTPKDRGFGIGMIPTAKFGNKRFGMIKNTQVEKLVEEAHALHLAGDVVRAILKLDEADLIDPKEPATTYRRAQIYEDMRNWERATDAYSALFSMGPEIGAYYEIAADKMTNGVKESPDTVPFLLGNVTQRVSKNQLHAKVTVPIRRLTDREFEPSQIEVRIFFYDMVDNKTIEAVPKQREQNIAKRWISGAADWADSVEETIEAEYQLPNLDRANVHLFGERKYFGKVIELYYKGDLIDQYGYPGRVHGFHAKEQFKHQIQPDILPFDLQEFDGSGTDLLLPSIDN